MQVKIKQSLFNICCKIGLDLIWETFMIMWQQLLLPSRLKVLPGSMLSDLESSDLFATFLAESLIPDSVRHSVKDLLLSLFDMFTLRWWSSSHKWSWPDSNYIFCAANVFCIFVSLHLVMTGESFFLNPKAKSFLGYETVTAFTTGAVDFINSLTKDKWECCWLRSSLASAAALASPAVQQHLPAPNLIKETRASKNRYYCSGGILKHLFHFCWAWS